MTKNGKSQNIRLKFQDSLHFSTHFRSRFGLEIFFFIEKTNQKRKRRIKTKQKTVQDFTYISESCAANAQTYIKADLYCKIFLKNERKKN